MSLHYLHYIARPNSGFFQHNRKYALTRHNAVTGLAANLTVRMALFTDLSDFQQSLSDS
jgi:hypothetical protein